MARSSLGLSGTSSCPRDVAKRAGWSPGLAFQPAPQLLIPTGHLHTKLEPGSGAVEWDSQTSSLCCTSLGALRASCARHKIVVNTPCTILVLSGIMACFWGPSSEQQPGPQTEKQQERHKQWQSSSFLPSPGACLTPRSGFPGSLSPVSLQAVSLWSHAGSSPLLGANVCLDPSPSAKAKVKQFRAYFYSF